MEGENNNLLPGAPAPSPQAAATEFHRLFPQVPNTENVVQEFQCSLSRKKLLRVGRLYVTPVRLCFNSMLVEAIELPWTEVASCEKKSQMLFDQIIITPVDRTKYGGELCFTGFMNGCSSPFSTIKMLWGVRRKYSTRPPSNGSLTGVAVGGAGGEAPSPVADRALTPPASPRPRSVHEDDAASRASPRSVTPPQVTLTPSASRPDIATAANAHDTTNTAHRVSPGSNPPPHAEHTTGPDGLEGVAGGPTNESFAATDSSKMGMSRGDDNAADLLNASPSTAATPRDRAASQMSPPRSPAVPRPVSPAADETSAAAAAAGAPPLSHIPASPPPAPTTRDAPSPQPTTKEPAASASPAASPVGLSNGEATAAQGSTSAEPSPTAGGTATHRRQKSEAAAAGGGGGAGTVDTERLQAASALQSDFLKSFPNVPRNESILDSFQCSYVSGVHRLGKMHITGNYLLFQSVMLAEPIVVKLSDIQALEKSTSLLVLDGLSISLRDGTRHEFTSFISRERAYVMLQQLIATHEAMRKTLGSNVSAGARPSSPARGLNEPMPRSAAGMASPLPPAASPMANPASATPPASLAASDAGGGDTASATAAAAANDQPAAAAAAPKAVKLNTSQADPTADFIPIGDFNDLDSICPTEWGTAMSKPSLFFETPLTQETLMPVGYTLFDLFHVCFDENAPVMMQYREWRRDTDTVLEPWRAPKAGGKPQQAGQRCMRCQTIIRVVVSEKFYPYEEFHRFAFVKHNGVPTLLWQASGQASGVTFSDTFRTETLCVYTEGVDAATGLPQVTARQYMYVQFLKFSVVKGKIRNESTKELKAGMARFNELTADALREAPSAASLAKAVGSTGKAASPKQSQEAARAVDPSSAAAPAGAHPAASSLPALARTPSIRNMGGQPSNLSQHVAGTTSGGAGAAAFMPPAGPARYVALAAVALAALYVLRTAWACLWFWPDEVPAVADAPGAGQLAGSDRGQTDLQLLAATQTIANFLAYVVRPMAAAASWAGLAFLVTWASNLVSSP